MSQVKKFQPVELSAVFGPVLRLLGHITGRKHPADAKGDLEKLQHFLETLPLSTEDFGLACARLKNAQRYLVARELGAARWELQTLRQQLLYRVETSAKEPRLRKRLPDVM